MMSLQNSNEVRLQDSMGKNTLLEPVLYFVGKNKGLQLSDCQSGNFQHN